ncbi:MAG: hypothetical protein NT062_23125 [Proteobacteria bacterium]|nr:hypothetical protein [Pseudomonadota bacterium]
MEVFFLMMGLWLVVAVALGMRKPRGLGGGALRARLDAVYGEPHELARISAVAFPEADVEFYDRAREALTGRGYTWLADVEDLTMSRIYPENRTFLRLFVDAGGMIRASVYHLHPRGIERLKPNTPLADIVARHEARITEQLKAHPERVPTTFERYEEVIASIGRAHVAMARHRRSVGGISRDELERLKGRPLSATEEAFLREVQGTGGPTPGKPGDS